MPRPRPTRWRLFFITIEQGGLRVGETVALRWATPTLLVVGFVSPLLRQPERTT